MHGNPLSNCQYYMCRGGASGGTGSPTIGKGRVNVGEPGSPLLVTIVGNVDIQSEVTDGPQDLI